LQWYHGKINNYLNYFTNLAKDDTYGEVNDNIQSDLSTSRIMIAKIQDFYNSMPEFQKTNVIDPINADIVKIEAETVELNRRNAFMIAQIAGVVNDGHLDTTLVTNHNEKIKAIKNILDGKYIHLKFQLYNGVRVENNTLNKEEQNFNNTSTKNDRHSNYLSEDSSWYNSLNRIMFFSYYSLIIVLLYIFFILDLQGPYFRMKMFFVILLICYPFVIQYIEEYFNYVFNMTFSFMFGNVYKDPNEKYITSNKDYQ
jgi:hypothetical protein